MKRCGEHLFLLKIGPFRLKINVWNEALRLARFNYPMKGWWWSIGNYQPKSGSGFCPRCKLSYTSSSCYLKLFHCIFIYMSPLLWNEQEFDTTFRGFVILRDISPRTTYHENGLENVVLSRTEWNSVLLGETTTECEFPILSLLLPSLGRPGFTQISRGNFSVPVGKSRRWQCQSGDFMEIFFF